MEEPGNVDVAGLFAAPERDRSASVTALQRVRAIQLQEFPRESPLMTPTKNLNENSGSIRVTFRIKSSFLTIYGT